MNRIRLAASGLCGMLYHTTMSIGIRERMSLTINPYNTISYPSSCAHLLIFFLHCYFCFVEKSHLHYIIGKSDINK